jgi:methylthioribose-1-phosphate isomerase
VGAADAIRRGSTAAAAELFDLGLGDPQANAARLSAAAAAPAAGAGPSRRIGTRGPEAALAGMPGESATYRSPYRVDGESIVILDRRALPERTTEMACREGNEVARAIRAGAVRGGPLLAQVAAYGLWLTALRHATRPVKVQRAELESAAAQLKRAEPSAHALETQVTRLMERFASLAEGPDPAVVADLLRGEADRVASEATARHAALARHGAGLFAGDHDGPVELLLHGHLGPMGNGLVGTGLGIVQLLTTAGREVSIWVTEGRPSLDGARVTAWELDQMGVPYRVLPDSAVTWLFEQGTVTAVLLAADHVAADGDAASVVGSGSIAALAAVAVPPIPVYLCVPAPTIAVETPDARSIPTTSAARAARTGASPPAARTVVAPTIDIVRGRHVAALITDAGVLRPPFAAALPVVAAAARSDAVPA